MKLPLTSLAFITYDRQTYIAELTLFIFVQNISSPKVCSNFLQLSEVRARYFGRFLIVLFDNYSSFNILFFEIIFVFICFKKNGTKLNKIILIDLKKKNYFNPFIKLLYFLSLSLSRFEKEWSFLEDWKIILYLLFYGRPKLLRQFQNDWM